MSIISSIILIFVFGASLFLKRRSSVLEPKKVFKYIFWAVVFIFFIFLFYQARQLFLSWQNNAPGIYLIPPYLDISSYFLGYSYYVFFMKPTIALLSAIIFLVVTMVLNRKFQERFFEKEELYFGALSIFLIGYPGLIFYLIMVLVSGLAGSIITKRRFSAYYLWFPMAIFVILIIASDISKYNFAISIWLKDFSIWQTLKL